MTLACSHTSRQADTRTGTCARRRAVCAAWSVPITFGLPQQQSRHTTTRHGTASGAPASAGGFSAGLASAGIRHRSSLPEDPPRWSVEEATA
ncbi:hypothetical protein SHIRM173S_12449 [Streptomyces hirsutus]